MTNDIAQLKVAVLGGGWSDEREVSLISAGEVERALRTAGFTHVDKLDIASDGFVSTIANGNYDVAMLALHGKYGEDGCIQGMLEVLHIPYTFSGVLASSAAMAKDVAKHLFEGAGLPVAQGVTLSCDNLPTDAELDEIVRDLGLPLFVKPACNGSSFGISHVTDRSQLLGAIELAAESCDRVLIEKAVQGREITVPVIGNDDPQALPVIEIEHDAEFYDQTVKYEPAELHHRIPAPLPTDVYARVQDYAVRAHRALGCRGCSRSDFILRDDGEAVLLEVNTIPGMTSASLLPDSARHAGIEFDQLCKRFVELALED